MAEDTKAQKEPEKKTQVAPMPSAEQKTPESSDVVVKETTSTEKVEEGLPEDASDRTKHEFDKLQQQLRDERTRREYYESVFQSMQTQKPEQPKSVPVYDPETGLVNEQAFTDLQKQSLEATARAERAETAVQQYLQDQEEKQVYQKYPELNPNLAKTHNKTLHVKVRRLMVDSMLNPNDYGGKQIGFMEAADLAKEDDTSAVEQAKKEGAKEAMEQLTPKEQASLEAVGTPGRRTELSSDLEELKILTRKGNIEAIAERLRRISPKE